MKKYLIVLAAAVVALASCGPTENNNGLTSLNFKEAKVSALVGDTLRLVLLAEPADIALPEDLAIASSDTNVVKVLDNKVNIAAVGSGTANVTAKTGDLTAVCQVTVSTYQEAWALDWIYYFPATETVFSTDTVVYGDYKCLLESFEFFMPSTLDFAEDLSSGDGECVFATAVVPVIAEGEYKGEMLARQFQIVESADKLGAFTAVKGNIDPTVVGGIFQPYFEGLDAGEQGSIDWDLYEASGVTGVLIREAFISETGGISYYYQADGIVTSGYFQRAVDQEAQAYVFVYDFTAQWFGGFWGLGLATNWDAESYSEVLLQPFAAEYSSAYHYVSGEPAQPLVLNAPAKVKKAARQGFIVNREKPVRVKFAPEK